MKDEFAAAGIIELPEIAYERFFAFQRLLAFWNQRLNLTAVREPQQVILRHFVECAFVARKLPAGIASLLDFGSGAGFPGIPIAILRPEIAVTLAESQGKKAAFLQEALRTLELRAEVFAGRVESMPSEKLFDAVTMRAVDKFESAIPAALARVKRYLVLLATEETVERVRERADALEWSVPELLPGASRSVFAIAER